MRRSLIAFVILTLLFASVFTGCYKLHDSISEAEEEKAVSLLDGMGYSGPNTQVALLYSKTESPKYMLAVSDNGYVIIGRSGMKLIEAGEGASPYGEYMALKKYYGEIMSYVVYDPYNAETPFHSLRNDAYGATYEDAVKGR